MVVIRKYFRFENLDELDDWRRGTHSNVTSSKTARNQVPSGYTKPKWQKYLKNAVVLDYGSGWGYSKGYLASKYNDTHVFLYEPYVRQMNGEYRVDPKIMSLVKDTSKDRNYAQYRKNNETYGVIDQVSDFVACCNEFPNKVHTITCCNVLNVQPSEERLDTIIHKIYKIAKKTNSIVLFQVYDANRGVGKDAPRKSAGSTTNGYQLNKGVQFYKGYIEKYFKADEYLIM